MLKALPVRALAAALVAQAVAYYAVASRSEKIPAMASLSGFPTTIGRWTTVREFPIEKEVQDVLKADDTVNRLYADPQREVVSFFLAYFKTQRYGQAPHSPKNCLPGSGWQPLDDRKVPIEVPGRETPIVVNQYVISRGDQQSVVLYWYQSHSRVIAGEFAAKFWLVADAIRTRRSDTALVRIIVPVAKDVEAARITATEFARAVYPAVARQLPQ